MIFESSVLRNPAAWRLESVMLAVVMRRVSWLVAVVALLVLLLPARGARAERNTLGPHVGLNFDVDDLFLGLEGRFDVATIDQSVIVQLNPSFSLYFTHDVNLFNFSFNVPFEFQIHDSVLRPFAAPGLALYHATGRGSNTDAKLNLIGGLLFHLQALEPFVQLRIAVGGGSTAELMGGLLFRL
jgi:hypothetical protein